MRTHAVVIGVLVATVQGCSGTWWPFGSSGGEANRIPPGAAEFACARGKRLFVRFADDGRSAWVILPDREFRLERKEGSDAYTNATTRLSATGDSTQLDVEGTRQYADCKRKSA